jgi:four helix bundle protein
MGSRKSIKPLHYDLDVWKEAMRLAREVYRATVSFPASEQYGLTVQIRRSVVSVPSNIAEGAGRGRVAEYAHHLRIARGSLMELDTQLWIARDLGLLVDSQQLHESIQKIAAMLNALITSKTKKTLSRNNS